MSTSNCVVPSRDVVVRRLNGEQVLFHIGSGHCFGLDTVGASVWEQMETGRTIEWLAGFVSGRFQVDPDACMSDLLAFTSALRQHGLSGSGSRPLLNARLLSGG